MTHVMAQGSYVTGGCPGRIWQNLAESGIWQNLAEWLVITPKIVCPAFPIALRNGLGAGRVAFLVSHGVPNPASRDERLARCCLTSPAKCAKCQLMVHYQ